jgi:hypothetical protein
MKRSINALRTPQRLGIRVPEPPPSFVNAYKLALSESACISGNFVDNLSSTD